MKKFILPLTVVVLAAGKQLTSFDPKVSSEKHAASKQATVDIGTFSYLGINYEAYGTAGTHLVTNLIDVNGNAITAHGSYSIVSGRDQGTMNVTFTPNNATSPVTFNGTFYI
ncbi:hypothetical protein [Mucilaginibacter polytrichastri]|uniref:Uncharacterized protein n=1 Tax=Mucilaginibacter polytrichastri TaxID=1302689 RepID=A0A1Q5ZUJ6_9SPHI|nr:hypothetical protein [Mucilaginibacter polytrichastri]OKS85358.1 hypothetical protein RG47T_0803 [Mucilaginibacter polytrichastri]SFS40170.1 hypothetical protein SAMN04487890_101290 [Mucilaginibacter polytrichastri]